MNEQLSLDEKVEQLKLIPVNEENDRLLSYFVCEQIPYRDWNIFDYVIWVEGEPVFYTKEFLSKTDISEIKEFLELRALEIQIEKEKSQ